MSRTPTLSPVEEVVAFLASGPSREAIASFRLSEAARDHLHNLLGRDRSGRLTPDEARELDQMVLLDDIIALIRARVHQADPPTTAATWPDR